MTDIPGMTIEPTPELIDEIARDIAKGITLSEICRRDHMPARQRVYEWMEADRDLAGRIARARDLGYGAIAEDCIDIVDNRQADPDPSSRRVRADIRLKLLAKWSPRIYGERTQIAPTDTDGNNAPFAPIMFVGVEAKPSEDET